MRAPNEYLASDNQGRIADDALGFNAVLMAIQRVRGQLFGVAGRRRQ